MLCANADSWATPAPVLARMPTIVRASGKEQLDMPRSTAQAQAPPAGARYRPAYPASPQRPSAITIGPCRGSRVASRGMTKASGTPITIVTARSSPAVPAETPASRKICAIQPMVM